VTSCGLKVAILSQNAVISSFSVLSPTWGRADGVHRPMIGLPMRDESTYADDRVVDVLGELVADRLAGARSGVQETSYRRRDKGAHKPPRACLSASCRLSSINLREARSGCRDDLIVGQNDDDCRPGKPVWEGARRDHA
jgi:hypothetical protein